MFPSVSCDDHRGHLPLFLSRFGGHPRPFKGWNCRHDWYPYFEGSARMYSPADLAALEEKNIEFPDGSMHTYYEAEQYPRSLERKIRESRRILAGEDEWIKNNQNAWKDRIWRRAFDIQSSKLKEQEAALTSFCKKPGLIKIRHAFRLLGLTEVFRKNQCMAVKENLKNTRNICIIKMELYGSPMIGRVDQVISIHQSILSLLLLSKHVKKRHKGIMFNLTERFMMQTAI